MTFQTLLVALNNPLLPTRGIEEVRPHLQVPLLKPTPTLVTVVVMESVSTAIAHPVIAVDFSRAALVVSAGPVKFHLYSCCLWSCLPPRKTKPRQTSLEDREVCVLFDMESDT